MALQRAGLKETDLNYIATTGFGATTFLSATFRSPTSPALGEARYLSQDPLRPGHRRAEHKSASGQRQPVKVREFRTNDQCAAGAGGFIERACKYLEVNIDQVGDLSMQASKPQTISSVCAVLAESEIINHVSNGETVDNILRGVHNSLASRALALLKRLAWKTRLLRRRRGAAKRDGEGTFEETLKEE